jgi:hypothetical protein
MDRQDVDARCDQIIDWFVREHNEWVEENKLVSWARKLGIDLNRNDSLDENSLFHLFVLAVLWNSCPTYQAERGEEVFEEIKDTYTLTNFRDAVTDRNIQNRLIEIARKEIKNIGIFNILNFITNGKVDSIPVWARIKNILTSENIGDKDSDVTRLKNLYRLFNPERERYYTGQAYLTKKIFLIFREIRIQFRQFETFQYHPYICCVPDNHVQQALIKLGILDPMGNGVNGFLEVSKIVAEHFCQSPYELYDLPLFLTNKEKHSPLNQNVNSSLKQSLKDGDLGICPKCGSRLVWRRARKTCERYRGCTNFQGGCRWNDRSY